MLFFTAVKSQQAQSFFEGFNDTSLPANWQPINHSDSPDVLWDTTTAIVVGSNPVISPFEGSRFAAVGYTSSSSASSVTLSNWLLSPTLSLNNGDTFSFYTMTVPGSQFPDRLELRLSLNGSSSNVGTTSTDVGDFTISLLSVNPTLATGGYPESWTQFTATLSGLSGPTSGRFAFRYFVTDGGPNGANSNFIGVDAVSYLAVPEPSTDLMLIAGALATFVGVAAFRRRTLRR